MDLNDIKNNTQAEIYAIYHAIFYIDKYKYENSIILSDNQPATKNSILVELAKHLNTQISWIPREINKIADKNSRLEPTVNEYNLNILKRFIDLSERAFASSHSLLLKYEQMILNLTQEIEKFKKEKQDLQKKIKNQANEINNLKNKLKK
jgi:uncharacterized protein (DUF342 family)